jgi:small conductance mechanosensitive channel
MARLVLRGRAEVRTMNFDELAQPVVDKVWNWGQSFLSMLPNLLLALFVVVLFVFLGKLAAKGARLSAGRSSMNRAAVSLLSSLTRIAVVLAGVVIALGVLELDKALASVLAGAGVVGLALGFAFQDVAANLISGVGLAAQKDLPFRIGDLIEAHDVFGTVTQMSLRTTLIETPQGQIVVLPNKELFQHKVVNYTLGGARRVDLVCGVSYGDDLEKVREVVLGTVEGLECRVDRPPECFFTEFGSSSINLVARYWIDFEKQAQFMAAQDQGVRAIKRAFDDADITIPFPIRTLDFGIKGGLQLSEAAPRLTRTNGQDGEEGASGGH